MRIKELIKELSRYDPECEVLMALGEGCRNGGYKLISEGNFENDPDSVQFCVEVVWRGCSGKVVYLCEAEEVEE